MSKFTSFFKDENGAAMIEYSLLAALIGIGLVFILGAVQDSLSGLFTNVQTSLDNA